MPGRVSASSGTGARLRVAVLGEVGAVPVPVSRVSPPHRSVAERTPAFRCGVWGGVPAYSPSGCAVAVRGGAGGARTQRGVRARGPLEASFDLFFFSLFFIYLRLYLFISIIRMSFARRPRCSRGSLPKPPPLPSQLRGHSSTASPPPYPPRGLPPALPHSPQRCVAFGQRWDRCSGLWGSAVPRGVKYDAMRSAALVPVGLTASNFALQVPPRAAFGCADPAL